MVDVDPVGQAYGAMAALAHLRQRGRGALFPVSSIKAKQPLPLNSAYAAGVVAGVAQVAAKGKRA